MREIVSMIRVGVKVVTAEMKGQNLSGTPEIKSTGLNDGGNRRD